MLFVYGHTGACLVFPFWVMVLFIGISITYVSVYLAMGVQIQLQEIDRELQGSHRLV